MYPNLERQIDELSQDVEKISDERRSELDDIAVIINQHLNDEESLDIIVVCTHNSRRSQLGEIWINILAEYFDIKNIRAYSGGMEATAFNHRMVHAIRAYGINLKQVENGTNPRYALNGNELMEQLMYSKVYDDESNPKTDFMALMVCDHADENCPIVHGMKYRIPLRYKDPKAFDDTEREVEAYRDKVVEVGRELYYMLSQVNSPC